jgi:hypothetical protein
MNPKRGVAYTTSAILMDTANRPFAKENPTLAAGDVTISKDDGAFANLATLPTVTPAGGAKLKTAMSATEMTADRVDIRFKDQTVPSEWDEMWITIDTEIRPSVGSGIVTSGATTTVIPTSTLTPPATVADQFKGRIVIFDENTATAALRGQATDITSNTNTGTLTVTALTSIPASGDSFIIA